jgi:type IV secretory pathway TraG/TraD family ATPase VirD4
MGPDVPDHAGSLSPVVSQRCSLGSGGDVARGKAALRRHIHMHTVHTLLVGKTGSGKSTLLKARATRVMAAGHGLLLVDPHGDLVDELLTLVPKRRKNDLVLFDPRTGECPGLNPLRNVPSSGRTLVISGIIATMRKIWPDAWGPRTEHLLRYTLLALCEVRGATLTLARDVLSDEKQRNWVLKQCKDDETIRFWVQEFMGYDKRLQSDAVAPPLNKLGAFIAHRGIRTILEKRRPVLDPARCLERSRIVLARLSKGAIGEDGAVLLGGLLLGSFQRAIMAREALPREERTPFHVMVDEVSSFATKPFLELLAEARKYGISLSLATQSMAAMDPDVRAAILGNIGELVAFRVGAEDAALLQKEFASVPRR